jgi:hypothetical protein
MNREITPENANRLALGLARQRRIHYRDAEALLRSLTLKLVINAESCRSLAFQAALLTAFNSGNRAFLGGVSVEMPDAVKLLLPLPGFQTLNEALRFTGFAPRANASASETIFFGHTPAVQTDNSCRADCDGWRGAVSDFDDTVDFEYEKSDDIALGGVFAGGLAVHRCFLKAAGIQARSLEVPIGLSLWMPGTDWHKPVSPSPLLFNLPNRLWLLGLGHLGQAFLWNLALLPFPQRREIELLLQDFDLFEPGNLGSGLVCTPRAVGQRKTRVCADWSENLGFTAKITERRYTEHDRRHETEPPIALCGFDRAKPRSFLEKTGFGLIVECGLGDGPADFDTIHIHSFPNSINSAEGLWGDIPENGRAVDEQEAKLFEEEGETCGQLAIDTAGKAVSTSFVGAMAGALVTAELLRVFNGGNSFEEQFLTPRNMIDTEFCKSPRVIRPADLAALGFCCL